MGTKERLEILRDMIEPIENWQYVSGTRDIGKSYFQNLLDEKDNVINDLLKRISELEFEVERLTELCNKYEEEHRTTFEQWKKTISIIDELEKYINYKIEQCYNEGSNVGEFNKICDIDEKLKELKGSDKE